MDKLVIGSMGRGAGKTSLIIGMGRTLGRPFGYLKPFGDRMVYREKKVWDYDADLVMNIFGMKGNPEEMTIGFEHAKLRYMYDEEGRRKKLREMVSQTGEDLILVEGREYLRYGLSIGLDFISITRHIDGKLLIVIDGNEDVLMDDAVFVKNFVDMTGVAFKGVIFNKVQNVEDFRTVYLRKIEETGLRVLGVIPYEKELTYLTVNFLARRLFAKVITGENNLNRVVKNILVGAMSIDALFQTHLLQKEDKLVITSGDRADMILAAIESDAVCVVITNNILPHSNIIAKAYEHNIPMLMVPHDTYQVVTKINAIEPLLTKEDTPKIDLLGRLIETHVNLKEIVGT